MIGVVSMARLKMVGIINENEIIKYQKYNTNKKMTLINNDKDNIQIKAIPICVFLIILCNVVLFLKLFNRTNFFNFRFFDRMYVINCS